MRQSQWILSLPINASADYFEKTYIPYQPEHLNFLNLTELSPADLDFYLSCDGNISPEPSGDLVDFLVSEESYPTVAGGNPSPGDLYHIIDDLEEFIFPSDADLIPYFDGKSDLFSS